MPIKEDKEFLKEQLKECLYFKRLMIEKNQFWEHFTDHMIIASSFMCLGILLGFWILRNLFTRMIKVDYDMPKGTIMRIYHDDKKWFVIRPKSMMQFFDILFLAIFDTGKDKYIDKHSKYRARVVTTIIIILVLLFIITGILEVLSAFAWSMNPFDYIGHRT